MSYANKVRQQKAVNRAKELAKKKKAERKAAPQKEERKRFAVLKNGIIHSCANCGRLIEPHVIGMSRRYDGHYPEDCKK